MRLPYNLLREDFLITRIQISQQGDCELLSIDFSIKREREGNRATTQFFGKMLGAVVYVYADANDGEMRRVFLGAHFHEDAGHFFPLEVNVVWQLYRGRRGKLLRNCSGDGCRCPFREASRLSDVDPGPKQN